MRYDQLVLKATITLAITWALIRTTDALIDHYGTTYYWRRMKGIR
jgi:hypothetical protein